MPSARAAALVGGVVLAFEGVAAFSGAQLPGVRYAPPQLYLPDCMPARHTR